MMKRYFAIIFCCALMAACKKDNQNAAQDLFIGAMRNGSNWVAKPTAGYFSGKDSLQIQGFKAAGEENLLIDLAFHGAGTYTLKAGQARYFTTIGLDALTSDYKLDTTLTNTVTIRNYNYYTGIANGTFQLNFTRVNGGGADKLVFSGGVFYVYVPE